MKRKLLVAVPLLCLVALLAWLFRPKHESLGEAYVGERSITLWSSVAQVREQTTAREQPVLSPKDKDRDRKDEHLRDEASHGLHEH